ncbi:hypothetical protein P154DRAFT_568739 [Amniculicola lignicola CBS 123094]|uniref:Uncharacterized protein n=1 Tax=Amniculicola lignicola CBS 123094 TaxID=1392246 RepID=A0A6A5X4M5_9PLEO|nr:hypothetical protein P154DRAFT_568739 [Amniculicola lignicola CBS 123094]
MSANESIDVLANSKHTSGLATRAQRPGIEEEACLKRAQRAREPHSSVDVNVFPERARRGLNTKASRQVQARKYRSCTPLIPSDQWQGVLEPFRHKTTDTNVGHLVDTDGSAGTNSDFCLSTGDGCQLAGPESEPWSRPRERGITLRQLAPVRAVEIAGQLAVAVTETFSSRYCTAPGVPHIAALAAPLDQIWNGSMANIFPGA